MWPIPAAEVIDVPAGETLNRVVVQDAAADAVAVRDFVVRLGVGATANFHVLNTGGRLGRITIDVTASEGSHFELGAALLGGGEQTVEIVTTMRHVEPNATSNQLVRAVLSGKATGSYLGKVAVARHAQKTDATQSVKAMLLDRTRDGEFEARAGNLRRRREVRAWRDGGRTRCGGVVLSDQPRHRAGAGEGAAAGGVHRERVRGDRR